MSAKTYQAQDQEFKMSEAAAPAAAPAEAAPAPVQVEGKSQVVPSLDEARAVPKEATKSSEKYEIKVNGRTKMVGRDELIRLAQLSEAATERFESASQKERRAEQIINNAKKNPMEALLDPALGLTKDQVRSAMEEWYNREFIEPETLTEEQRRYKAIEAENAVFKRAQAEENARVAKEAESRADSEYLQHFQKQIIDAMDTYKLPKTKSSVKKIAFYMRQSLANGWEAPMDLIIQKVKDDRRSEDEEINEYSYEDIVDRFGEEFVKKVIAENLKRLRDKRASASGSSFSSRPVEPSGSKPGQISMREAAQRLKAMRTGKL